MAAKFQALKGMEDLLPGEIEKWQWVEQKARNFFESFGFKEIRTPLLEYTELFSRSVGEASDIVHKEMFSFEDRGGRNITLRPEMTASVARAVLEHGLLTQAKSLQLYYLGPMFRAERPQAGRKRQFHQIGIELIHQEGTKADETAIFLLCDFLSRLGIKNYKLRVNDLGTVENQKKTAQHLHQYFSSHKNKLCPDCQYRLEKNVLRIFDCKNPGCKPVIGEAPWEKIAPLSGEFQKLIDRIKERRIPHQIDRRLVRGLDYYNGAVFEVSSEELGAQDALAGGGRYDRLYEDLGGKPTPCTGFSIGVERLIAVLDKAEPPLKEKIREKSVYFAALDEKSKGAVYETVSKLRDRGICAVLGADSIGLADHLKTANKFGFKYVVIAGPDERESRQWTVKHMDEKEQKKIPFGQLFRHLAGEETV